MNDRSFFICKENPESTDKRMVDLFLEFRGGARHFGAMPKRDAAHMEAQRLRIMQAALRCIAEKGVERTSIGDIRTAAGLSTGAIYVHFKDKDELVSAVLAHFTPRLGGPSPSSWLEFKAYLFDEVSPTGLAKTDQIRALLNLQADAMTAGPLQATMTEMMARSAANLTDKLQGLVESGEIALRYPIEDSARIISGLVNGVLWQAITAGRPLEQEIAMIKAALDAFVQRPPGASAD
ncbi:TetR/AcrR family transcriptional regulator [Sphingomonas colocasiae]|uniref:TetR/AcrR family transcriptional regulator n=1 Tax=Sphingomonas colocasiae TaxID=1848973 RepID=A0ABS7PSJ2_9SPHN|nr:TetR/AcrR family transcriptional regulator [Sphingomonas colocasiae]MBY8824263.1 TetR/AcrR family transcriptional regulator [Sphingomonas colocasiae]